MYKSDNKIINEPKLIIRLLAILSTYKYRQPLRRFILYLMENALTNGEILESCQQILESLDQDMF
jgi:hypothetical protein